MSQSRDNYLLYFSLLLVAFIFSNWDFKNLIFNNNLCCQQYGAINQNFFIKPYISFILSDLLEKLNNPYVIIAIAQVIVPSAIFYMLIIIFNKYLNIYWSITIGLVSLFSFSNHTFRDFLISLIIKNEIPEVVYTLPEIANFPIPSISVLLFLIIFYHSTKLIKLSFKRVSFFTALWALMIYINPIDALFGIVFWFCYFFIRLFKSKSSNTNLIKIFLSQTLICILIWLPTFLLINFSPSEVSISHNFNVLHYFSIYIFLPLILMFLLFKIHKIDIIEIFYNFWQIYVLMLLESILIILAIFLSPTINIDILTRRIPLFFLHFYYFLPIIFYGSRQYLSFNIGNDGNYLNNFLRKIIFISFNKLSFIYLPLISIAIIFYAFLFNNNLMSSFL